jgi:hypothetical protein
MSVTDVMSGYVRPVSSLPNGQADSYRGSCFMRSKRDAVQGWDTLVRGTISKGRFVQGTQHPKTFGQGHIGRGHINPAYTFLNKTVLNFKMVFWDKTRDDLSLANKILRQSRTKFFLTILWSKYSYLLYKHC